MAAHAELDGMKTTRHKGLSLPRVPEPADACDVIREQLDYLIGHATERGTCACYDCQPYLPVRSVLLEIFSEPEPHVVQQLTAVPMAA